MHYKNGRPAVTGDFVLGKNYAGLIVCGSIHTLVPAAQTCNAILAIPVPGGVVQNNVTVSECYHCEDALEALEKSAESAPQIQQNPVSPTDKQVAGKDAFGNPAAPGGGHKPEN